MPTGSPNSELSKAPFPGQAWREPSVQARALFYFSSFFLYLTERTLGLHYPLCRFGGNPAFLYVSIILTPSTLTVLTSECVGVPHQTILWPQVSVHILVHLALPGSNLRFPRLRTQMPVTVVGPLVTHTLCLTWLQTRCSFNPFLGICYGGSQDSGKQVPPFSRLLKRQMAARWRVAEGGVWDGP